MDCCEGKREIWHKHLKSRKQKFAFCFEKIDFEVPLEISRGKSHIFGLGKKFETKSAVTCRVFRGCGLNGNGHTGRNAGCVRPRIENGRAKVRARGKMVYFRCRKKFTRIGPKFAVCLPNSVWSQPAPICIGRGCPTIVPKDGLQISGEYDGAMLKFTCPAGMKREGPESIHCNGKKWNADQPSCVVGISLQCDFEQEELCGWSQSDDDDFEWTWLSGKTPTVNTGPLRDHTHASNSTGHYLFIESSSPRKPLDRAVLASPLYQAKYSDTCFEFWYHMQGPDEENAVGSLEVFVKPESLTINDIDPEFIMEGNQGADWKRGTIYIEGQTEVFQIIIVGTRKEAFVSDIAIDDVRMYNCSEDSLTTAEADEMTTESESSSPDVQSSIITQKITSTTISKPSATTKAVNDKDKSSDHVHTFRKQSIFYLRYVDKGIAYTCAYAYRTDLSADRWIYVWFNSRSNISFNATWGGSKSTINNLASILHIANSGDYKDGDKTV
ncbi:hypothetical protein LOTGIDRAFT_160467 [Lottia gigantea]|uniref:Sushi domain-containing protein n=1 Tax=Lottia gigantea TaxID=225164 RepID=V4ANZ6_LOTGI|nr:hypothetical protein LOTGIDRAFT_160467 [Lottia gigantea]ESO95336.1 hypothetical protein LOTGIDRAFT_160467 [Lottia gigantea]